MPILIILTISSSGESGEKITFYPHLYQEFITTCAHIDFILLKKNPKSIVTEIVLLLILNMIESPGKLEDEGNSYTNFIAYNINSFQRI